MRGPSRLTSRTPTRKGELLAGHVLPMRFPKSDLWLATPELHKPAGVQTRYVLIRGSESV
jgi:hypothetical protein